MKYSIIFYMFLAVVAMSFKASAVTDDVTYRLTYDEATNTYTVAAKSQAAYTGTLSRLTASTQVSIVFPHAVGGYQVSNLTGAQGGTTPLNWAFTRIDAPTENPNADYLFFNPDNVGTYTVFDFPAGTYIDLFSFEAVSGCLGDVELFDNTNDPLNNNLGLNPDNSFVILGGGFDNKYAANDNSGALCSGATLCMEYDKVSESFIVSVEFDDSYTGPLARLSPSTQISVVAPTVSGGYVVTNLMGLQSGTTPLEWSVSQINAPTENPGADYLVFTPSNATSYSPFNISANTKIPLFSFQSSSGCLDLELYDNQNDPLSTNPFINPDINIVILGAGPGNLYMGDPCGTAFCCASEAPVVTKN